ncbi:hypothetical protein SAMN02745216_02522 [Desulfatibacillum alkenivorans DSM 16219]|jgi:hypothetical protein|uniref:RiboL-PSP-HEPN domain-containing protein n=1 Tax=Desulfatibacillum alkenivorans DSM 16219 TaxID=1121393 RepID=A0A1M6N5M0_9BACT|nr:HEPN domain-containing protein [Desulfatibacillum alkenivorans]SHJ90994.1 hypothetical protein SAMN02745216_02522 [Desulfatibacillum alkenivorans DSM 16219]
MRAYDLAIQNFSVAEHLLQLHELFRGLQEGQVDEHLRLAVCSCLDVPEQTVLRHAKNDRVVMVAKATAPIPQSLLVPDGTNFLLRQAVVVGCTSLESFFWDALRENVLTIVRARKRGADESLRKITLSLDDYLSLEGWEDPDLRLQQIILKNFERGTLYDPSSIERIAKILTVKKFWDQVAAKTGNPDNEIKRHIGEIITRRNQIAHRADRPDENADPPEEQDGHGLRAINYAWANTRVATAKNVVSAASEIFTATLKKLEEQLDREEEQRLARQTMRS